MTYFTSGKVSHDPEPWTSQYGNRYNAPWSFGERIEFTHAPRPEFDNHNPILVSLRRMQEIQPKVSLNRRTWAYLSGLEGLGIAIGATRDQITHARKVLTRLANLTRTETS